MRRGSVRLRLTVLFGALFLAAGATLLAITYGLVSHATNGIFVSSTNAGGGAGSAAGVAPAALPAADPLQAQATRIAGTAKAAENDALLLYSGIALGIMAVVSMALGWFAAGRALRPLRRITAAAQRISATNLHERLAVGEPDDDLRELADTIDDLFGRLDASFDTQRQFVANASHELRTPLARSRTMLEVALRDPGADAESLRATCRRVLVAGEEQERLLEALLTLARGQRGLDRRAPVDLAAVTRDVLAARGTEIAASGLEMAVTLEPALLAGDRALTERGVANLIDNALRHNVPGGAVWVTVGTESGQAVLTVANTGPDVPPAEVGRLLVPFERGGTAPSPRVRVHPRAATVWARPADRPGDRRRARRRPHRCRASRRRRLAAELAFPAPRPAWYPREAAAGAPAAAEADLAAAARRLRSIHPDKACCHQARPLPSWRISTYLRDDSVAR